MNIKVILNFVAAFIVGCCVIVGSGCKKLIEVEPPVTLVDADKVFATDATAIAAVTNNYAQMSGSSLKGGGYNTMTFTFGLSADELSLVSGVTGIFPFYYKNALTSTNLVTGDCWANSYYLIYRCNAAIEGLNASTGVSETVKKQLLGEARFMRALYFFNLVNTYGAVPLTLSTDYAVNSRMSRSSPDSVYQQIITDLGEAKQLLSVQFLANTLLTPTSERIRPTQWAANALLARVYLYKGEWAAAENEASTVINSSLFAPASLETAFLRNSTEAIFQLQPVNIGWNTEQGKDLVLPISGPNTYSYPAFLSAQQMNSFEANDQRKTKWVGSVTNSSGTYYYSNKYKVNTSGQPLTEYTNVLRIGEVYLIRAEARAQQEKIADAISDLNVIRTRAGLPGTNANTKTALLAAVLHERQTELFTEFGQRWFDLKRTGRVNEVMTIVTAAKGGAWNPNQALYPIEASELNRNNRLVQNPGY